MTTKYQKISCLPLNEVDNARVFVSFRKSTNEFEKMMVLADSVIKTFQGKRIHLMSIGSGDGSFEDSLVRKRLAVGYFHGIETNEQQRQRLKNIVSAWKTEHFIDGKCFDEHFQTDTKFDLILMSHVLYSLRKPKEAILKGITFLNRNGTLLIFHHTRNGSSEIAKKLTEHFDTSIQRFYNEELTIEDISEELVKLGQNHRLIQMPSEIDVTDFVKKKETEGANNVISFLLQTRFEKLPKYIQNDIFNMVEKRCVESQDGRLLFQNPVGMVELKYF